MRYPRPPKHDLVQAEINLMPLIDVCLVLVIVLLVVFPMVKATASPAALAPKPAAPQPASTGVLALDDPQLPVEILADGSLTVDGRPVEQAELQKVLGEIWTLSPNRPVIVKGNRRVRYAQVRWVLQSVNAAGFRRAGLIADRR